MAEKHCDSGVQDLVEGHREGADTKMCGIWYCTPCLDHMIECGVFDG